MGERAQVAMDLTTLAAGVLGGERVRLFRRSSVGPGWDEQLDIPAPAPPELQVGSPADVTVETLAGPLSVGVLLVHEAGPDAPLIVTHHGNNERPFDLGKRAKNLLNRALLDPTPPPATLVLLRAPFHDGPLRASTEAAGDVRTWMATLAASVATVDAVLEHERAGRRTVLTGLSLGGWVTNLHRAYRGSADLYVPMLAGAHLGRQLVDAPYRRMVSRRALARPDELRTLLDFGDRFRANPDANVAPLLARHDQFARLDDQLADYGDAPVSILDTGHVGAALAGGQLRAHLLDQLDGLAAPERRMTPARRPRGSDHP